MPLLWKSVRVYSREKVLQRYLQSEVARLQSVDGIRMRRMRKDIHAIDPEKDLLRTRVQCGREGEEKT